MAIAQLLFPARLRWIEREKANQPVSVHRDVAGDVLVIDPQTAQPGLAAKDDGPHELWSMGSIFLEPHGQINFHSGPRPAGLLAEVVREMIGVRPGVAMNVDDHE